MIAPPPYRIDYDLIEFSHYPFSALNSLKPYLSEKGLKLLFGAHRLPSGELERMAKWWAKVEAKLPHECTCGKQGQTDPINHP